MTELENRPISLSYYQQDRVRFWPWMEHVQNELPKNELSDCVCTHHGIPFSIERQKPSTFLPWMNGRMVLGHSQVRKEASFIACHPPTKIW